MTNDVEFLFVSLLMICISSLKKCLFASFAHLYKLGGLSLCYWVVAVLYIFWAWNHCLCDLQLLCLILFGLFIFLIISFDAQKAYIFSSVYLFFLFVSHAFGSYLRMHCTFEVIKFYPYVSFFCFSKWLRLL